MFLWELIVILWVVNIICNIAHSIIDTEITELISIWAFGSLVAIFIFHIVYNIIKMHKLDFNFNLDWIKFLKNAKKCWKKCILIYNILRQWRDGWEVEGVCLENRRLRKWLGGSNPSLSANNFYSLNKHQFYSAYYPLDMQKYHILLIPIKNV